MRSCLALIAVVLIAGFLLRSCMSDNPMRTVLESAGAIPPVSMDIEMRDWFLWLGRSRYLKMTNKSGSSVVISLARVKRPNGKVKKLEGFPSLIKPNDVAEAKLMDGYIDFQFLPGDQLEVFFEGFSIPKVIEFGPPSK